MLDIKLKKRATYLVPANFGLSSMVLLDMALKEGIKVVVGIGRPDEVVLHE